MPSERTKLEFPRKKIIVIQNVRVAFFTAVSRTRDRRSVKRLSRVTNLPSVSNYSEVNVSARLRDYEIDHHTDEF